MVFITPFLPSFSFVGPYLPRNYCGFVALCIWIMVKKTEAKWWLPFCLNGVLSISRIKTTHLQNNVTIIKKHGSTVSVV